MERAIRSIDGVEEVTVSFEHKRADIVAWGEACEQTGLAAIVNELKSAGYGGQVAEVRPHAGG